ncbi:MAG: cysteine desulfurase NifS [Candidatus Saganbacteria bacterium]|nr:cysteine desulfurase NifS [Candidatus Saganbacteria bacterium]
MKRIYLDYAATTPAHPQVVEVMQPYFNEIFGNPSSIHSFGQEARAAVEVSREKVAGLIGARTDEVVFTSGGTESDNFAVKGVAFANQKKGNHIIISAIEHHAVTEPCAFLKKLGFDITVLPVDEQGLVDLEKVKQAITDKTVLVSVMHANNEIGTIEPVEEIGKIAKEKGVFFHTDAVQTAGAIPIDVNKMNVDLLSVSAHKLYGPKGVGALYIRKGTKMVPFMHGGGQEKNRRGSTENVPGIVGFGKAAELAALEMNERAKHLIPLRDKLTTSLSEKIGDSILNGHPVKRLPNNVNFCFKFVEGESMLLTLDMEGIAASTGSACSSATLEPSHVLLAIGRPHEIAHGSIRFTLGRLTTEEDIDHVIDVFPKIVEKLRKMSPLYKGG